MPTVTSEKKFYARPHMGQVYRRQQTPTEYQDGFVVGIYTNGTFERDGKVQEEWFATIQYGLSEEARINSRTELVSGAVQWLPVEESEAQHFGGGYALLERRLAALEARLDAGPGEPPAPVDTTIAQAAEPEPPMGLPVDPPAEPVLRRRRG